jgi:hypothetical protein
MGRAYGAHLHFVEGPDDLRLVLRLKGHKVNEFGGSTRKALFVLGEALSDLTRLDVGVCNMGNKFLAADGKTEN